MFRVKSSETTLKNRLENVLYPKSDPEYETITWNQQHIILVGGENVVKIRLNRMGAKKRPFYRVVVSDSRAPRDGRFIEIIGHYNPIVDPVELVVDKEKAQDWLKKGAQPSDTVKRLFKQVGVIS
jgi:small subunit ribosomal protein S16